MIWLKPRRSTVRSQATVITLNGSWRQRGMTRAIKKQSEVITIKGSIAWEWQVKYSPHSLRHNNNNGSQRGTRRHTKLTDTHFQDWPDKNAEGQAIRHAWVSDRHKNQKSKSETDRRAGDWEVKKCGWVCGERDRRWKKKQAVDILSSSPENPKKKTTLHHDTNPHIAHQVSHTRTHTQRSVGGR